MRRHQPEPVKSGRTAILLPRPDHCHPPPPLAGCLQKKKTAADATLKKELSKADKLALKDGQAKLKLLKDAEKISEKSRKDEVRFSFSHLCADAHRSLGLRGQ